MSAYATCGHEIDGDWLSSPDSLCIEKSYTRESQPAISYSIQCVPCRDAKNARGELFASEKDAQTWLEEATREHECFLAFQALSLSGMRQNATKRKKRERR